ncbi:uncharacterized protein isoform X1 [Choristoneura fumiferana]|uniref:uncharacterized protein isoform X1 n=2 Tax=Choristoneura fumiferana TaxID=7141 RepID=UPI003D15797D
MESQTTQTSIDMGSPTISKPPMPVSFCCIKLEPLAYLFHVFIFVESTTLVGLFFLFVADQYGWIDGMVKNVGGFWYSYFLKIVFCLLLIAVVLCLLSMILACLMHKRAKFLFIFVLVVFVLGVMVLEIIGQVTLLCFKGSWFELSIALRDRLLIYCGWVAGMLYLGKFILSVKSAEEKESLRAAADEWPILFAYY